MTVDPVAPSLAGVVDELRRRLDSLERAPVDPVVPHRVSLTVTAFPSPPWRPPAAMSIDEIWVDTSSAVAADTTFTVSRNGTTLGTATVASGESFVSAKLTTPVNIDVHDVVTVTAGDTGSAQATVQVLGTSGHPITPSLGNGGVIPAARARIYSSSTNVPSDDGVLIDAWDHTDFAVGGATVDSTSRITVPTEGIYQVSAQMFFAYDDIFSELFNADAFSQVWSGTENNMIEFGSGTSGTWFTANTGAGEDSLTAGYDGFALVTAYCVVNDDTSDGTFELKLMVDGNEGATSGSYDLTQTASTFDRVIEAVIPVTSGTEIKLRGDQVGSTSGTIAMTGVDEHYLRARRLDAAPNVEIAIVQRDLGGALLDAVAVSDVSTRRALATNVACQASAGDYFEVYAYNPPANSTVVAGPPIYAEQDSIHKWLHDDLFLDAFAEFQVAWVGPGTGTRPGEGGG